MEFEQVSRCNINKYFPPKNEIACNLNVFNTYFTYKPSGEKIKNLEFFISKNNQTAAAKTQAVIMEWK